jgi:hypothetical protein
VVDGGLPAAVNTWSLLQHHVALTKHQGIAGGPLLLGLQKPYKPLCSNSFSSLTKALLQKYGVPTEFWAAH